MDTKTINTFTDRRRTVAARRTLILGLSSLLIGPVLGVLSSMLRPILDPASVNPNNNGLFRSTGFASVVFSLIFVVWALITGIRALRNGERSWPVWSGLLAAVLVGGFWVFMIIGESVFPH